MAGSQHLPKRSLSGERTASTSELSFNSSLRGRRSDIKLGSTPLGTEMESTLKCDPIHSSLLWLVGYCGGENKLKFKRQGPLENAENISIEEKSLAGPPN